MTIISLFSEIQSSVDKKKSNQLTLEVVTRTDHNGKEEVFAWKAPGIFRQRNKFNCGVASNSNRG